MTILPVGAELFHADRRTGMTKLSKFCGRKKGAYLKRGISVLTLEHYETSITYASCSYPVDDHF
jgi:hypothetical protein